MIALVEVALLAYVNCH